MTDSEILELLTAGLRSVAPERNQDFAELSLSRSISDLGLDSIAAMELVAYIEEQIDTTFPDEDLAGVHTLEDLAVLVRKNS